MSGAAGAAGGAAAAAAAAKACREREEEEQMTAYGSRDVAEGWEFKILRSAWGAFANPDKLKAILEDEGRAGWILVEKFDNNRIRLKRPTSSAKNDGLLDFDAYRSYVGMSEAKKALSILGTLAAVLAAIITLVTVFD